MAFAKGNQYGKKPKYKTPEEIQEKIDAYLRSVRVHSSEIITTIRLLTDGGIRYTWTESRPQSRGWRLPWDSKRAAP